MLVVAPALNSRVRHWVSDTDDAVAQARSRLVKAVEGLRKRGLDARGEVGDADPFNAINDALHGFEADEVIISTHPAGQSHWLERDLVGRAREAVHVPVAHMESAYGLEDAERAPAAA